MHIDKQTITKFDQSGPRYTSYPTAPVWSNAVNADTYQQKLAQFGRTDKTLSLYVHIPYCETLCYFCACTMTIRRQDEKYGDEYIDYLAKEIELVAQHVGPKKLVKQLHWGGGTPSFLSEGQMERLYKVITEHFEIASDAEVAIEIDPRRVTKNKLKVLKQLGFNRVSIGLQDFDHKVQESVNRIQPYEMVAEFNSWCREFKFDSLNFDLIYGLPYQTQESFRRTVEQVIELKPDRIALYSFAYLPWMKKHQGKMEADKLPSSDEKLEIFLNSRQQLLDSGYEAIAMDHFALKSDELAKAFKANQLYRNFMGYTVKPADEYIGLGVSAIGFLEKTFFQNYKTIPEYFRFLKQGELPIERGKDLSLDDEMRQWVIAQLMCHFHVNKSEFNQRFGRVFDEYFTEEDKHLARCASDDLITRDEHDIRVTDLGKIFIRNICMGFDWYLRQQGAHTKFSKTV